MKKLAGALFLFLFGGGAYCYIEILYRRRTHYSMFLAAGTCVLLIDHMERKFAAIPLWVRCTLGSVIITAVEFITGCIVNLWGKCQVWDYSHCRYQLLGQICFRCSVLWFLFTAAAIGCLKFFKKRLPLLFA